MKRRVIIILSLLIMGISLTGPEAKAVTVKNKKAVIYVKAGQIKKVRIKGYAKIPKWKSKNKNIVITPQIGYIQALTAGKTKIYAKVKKKMVKCTVVVMEKNRPILSLKEGTSGKLKVKYGGKKVTWKSSKPSVAKVSSDGMVKAK